ncbi:MAG: tRNA-(ms[2]io[6]A)-hydroxylase [Gammaproteobacteria bacterium]|nr:tRNA-(ms[2]io[6]A)-hydroxylase [Gammaproteobacteria bacterium]NVK88732.1 tRNA-(ms[2]io[6]A)-hydroxylase [Gammaproteobacteria bacterium]
MDISAVNQFLLAPTPQAWLDAALDNMDILLIDHARCEKKAASTALSLMFKFPERESLLHKLSRLAREELRHFEQVFELMKQRGVQYQHLSASRYAAEMRAPVTLGHTGTLTDVLIIGAYIEARSCERFAALAPVVEARDPELAKYYRFLLKSESRHFLDYLALAREYAPEPIEQRIQFFGELEAKLITEPDTVFRFHSGVPS